MRLWAEGPRSARAKHWVAVLRWGTLASCVGCTVILGIDDDYRARDASAAGGADGGVGGSAGASATGGDGGNPTGGAAGGAACPSGQKLCGVACMTEAADVGCGGPSCDPCHAPPNARAVCNANRTCGYECDPGYLPSGDGCQPEGGGGQGGGGGTAGAAGTGGAIACGSMCDGGACPPCPNCPPIPGLPLGPSGCCQSNGTCGGLLGICLPCP